MTLTVAVQMDPLDQINIAGDSSFALMLAGQARGHRLFHYLAEDLNYADGRVWAKAHPVTVQRPAAPGAGDHFRFDAPVSLDLGEQADVVLMRQDPPFDMAYITATHILEHLAGRTLVVNDPFHVRNAPEKLFVTHFEGLMPPTLVTSDGDAIRAFRDTHGDIIVKPLYGNGGAGVFRIGPGDPNLAPLLETFTALYREPVIVQRYLPEVETGDKRIVLVDGEPMGAINRIPAKGEVRSNLAAGGRAEATALTARDREICAAIGPALRDRGLVFAGIDVIGPWLTEINVTSPTGLRAIMDQTGFDVAGLLLRKLEEACTR